MGLGGIPVTWIVGLLAAVVVLVVTIVRARRVNAADPLQDRLAEHVARYMSGPGDDHAQDELRDALRQELKARQVPRDEWSFRLSSALKIESRRDSGRAINMAKIQSLVAVVERLGTPT